MRYIAAIILLALQLPYAADTPPHHVKTYPLKWADGDEVVTIVNQIIEGRGKAFKYSAGNELIVNTTDELHKQVDSLLKNLDKPVPNVQIEVIFDEHGKSRDSALGVSGSGKVVVDRSGTSTKFRFSPEIREQSTEMSEMNKQLLLVQSGREGNLHIGQEIPYADWLFYYGRSHGYIDWEFSFEPKRIGAVLVASPQVIGSGPAIKITLTPEIRALVGDTYRRFKYTALATTVTAYDGQPLRIGGGGQNREFYDRFLTGYSSSGSVKTLDITLIPRIKHVLPPNANR